MITVTFVNVGGREDRRIWSATMHDLNKHLILAMFAGENLLKTASLYLATCGTSGAIFKGQKLVGTFTYCDETDQMVLQE